MRNPHLPLGKSRGDIATPWPFYIAIFYSTVCIGDFIDNGGGHHGTSNKPQRAQTKRVKAE